MQSSRAAFAALSISVICLLSAIRTDAIVALLSKHKEISA
ncbi:hypothetical protein CUC76_09560 [Enterobacteriaceae bacterium S05]|nr:hypothetical protein CUC76_09560 [Enterobacteriaceae bacterium S05]